MPKPVALVLLFFLLHECLSAQFLLPGEGIYDVKIGLDQEEIEWELGFRGKRLNKGEATEEMINIAKASGLDFDVQVVYQHLMSLPVSDLLIKDNRVCLIQLSSHPEYYQMFCADIGTTEGLNFWDNMEQVEKIYGKGTVITLENKTYVIYKSKGLGMGLSNGEVRTIFIFKPLI